MDWIPDDVNKWLLWILLSLFSSQATAQETPKLTPVHTKAVYPVYRADVPPGIKNDWEDPAWQKVTPLVITFPMGTPPQFTPQALARVLYDEDYIYVQFKVEDRYVRSVVQRVNGPVSGDACVEFFFCPDTSRPETYFNMEVNAGGTPLLFCVTYPWKEKHELDSAEIRTIPLAHTLPAVVEPEITDPVTWGIEYKIPFTLLEKYTSIVRPAPGVVWNANFYKTANKNSNPHYLTWSWVDFPRPNFHLPMYFGRLEFK